MPSASLSAVLGHWTLNPWLVAGLVALAAGFVWLQTWPATAVSRGRQASFVTGFAVLALALLSPLDYASDNYLFSAHMLQHLLLVLLAAPLLVRAMPSGWARRITIHPAFAFCAFNITFALSHTPVWYEATLVHEPLHVLEHLVYLVTAVINWLPAISPAKERRLNEPMTLLYLFLQTLPMFFVGSILALANSVVYPFYAHVPRLLGISPLEDQSLAGLLMWIGGSFFYLGAFTLVFFRWANREIGLAEPAAAEPEYPIQKGEDTWLESSKLSA